MARQTVIRHEDGYCPPASPAPGKQVANTRESVECCHSGRRGRQPNVGRLTRRWLGGGESVGGEGTGGGSGTAVRYGATTGGRQRHAVLRQACVPALCNGVGHNQRMERELRTARCCERRCP